MSALAPESFDLSTLPSLPLSEKGKLPSYAAIYFALSSYGRVLYIGRSINIQERLRGHHRLPILKAFGNVSIAWLKENNSLALQRIEATLIEYFNPPLNKIPSYLKAEDTEKLVKYLTLSDRPGAAASNRSSAAASNRPLKSNVIPINKTSTSQSSQTQEFGDRPASESNLDSSFDRELPSPSEFKAVILEQAKKINYLEEKIADLQSMFQKQIQAHYQLTEMLVEQAKTIGELSRTQAQTNNRLLEVTAEQVVTISKISSALKETCTSEK